jgi:hypothetical protein
LKVPHPIESTLSPNITELNLSQLLKAQSPIFVTLLGIVTFIRGHFANASVPIRVTLLGMEIAVIDVQFSNADSPMDVMVLGSATEVIEGQL